MVQSFQEISSKVSLCASLLNDSTRDGPLAPQPNLLPCHFQLLRLEAFRNETLHQAKKGTSEDLITVKAYFEKLDKVVRDFDAWIWELSGMVLELVREGRMDTVVKILKICEVEGREDEKVSQVYVCIRS